MTCEIQDGYITMPDGSEVSYDGLPVNNFKLLFDDVPNSVFFLQSFDMPSVSTSSGVQPTPYIDLPVVGEKLVYQQVSFEFLVDTKLKNYREIYNWMKMNAAGDIHREKVGNAVLMVGDGINIRFNNIWPTSLGSMQFRVNNTEMQYITCVSTFVYDYFEFI